ncbi:MAG: hypothetical protein GKS03_02255 [Alphaproteobacteria bacterium]|nr:hypothetical protein [Alphaproteobacteria bacterium]
MGCFRSSAFIIALSAVTSAASSQEVVNFFQPDDGSGTIGYLGLHNQATTASTITLSATDDTGAAAPGGDVSITLGAEESFYFGSPDLEDGVAAATGAFGDGQGSWHITVTSTGALDVQNLLWAGGDASVSEVNHAITRSVTSGNYEVQFFTEDGASAFVTSLRVANRSSSAGTVSFATVDSNGNTLDSSAQLSLNALEAVVLTAADLENGNAALGLSGSIPTSSGFWKLRLNSSLDLGVVALASSGSGQVSDVSNTLSASPVPEVVNFFQPDDGSGTIGYLGLHNRATTSETVTLSATDDAGAPAPGGDITITLGAEESFYFGSPDLEDGVTAANGAFGDGEGFWHITAVSTGALDVQHLLWAGGDASVSEVNHGVAVKGGTYDVPFFTEDGASAFVTSLRVANRDDTTGRVVFAVTDSNGVDLENVADLSLDPLEAVVLTAADFEMGNASKGLSGTLPKSSGFWKLRLISDLDLGVFALASSGSGQVSDVSNAARVTGSQSNPALGAFSCKPTTAKAQRPNGATDFTYTNQFSSRLMLSSIADDVLARLDFNGDGLDDLIMGGANSNSLEKDPIVALQSNGDGTFTDVTSTVIVGTAETADSRGGIQADFNGDGLDDVAVFDAGHADAGQGQNEEGNDAGFLGQPATLLLSNNAGQFNVSTNLADAINVFQGKPELHHKSAAGGDIDGDGDVDILVESDGGFEQTNAHFYINDGVGNFTVDFDNRLANAILVGDPDRTFIKRWTRYVLSDLNNDGHLDLFMGRLRRVRDNADPQANQIIYNDGAGFFPEANIVELPGVAFNSDFTNVRGAVALDINEDGGIDLVLAHQRGGDVTDPDQEFTGRYVQVLLNDCDGTFTDVTASTMGDQSATEAASNPVSGLNVNPANSLLAEDLNTDGLLDLVMANVPESVTDTNPYVHLGQNAGSFLVQDPELISDGSSFFGENAYPIDLNGDGILDFVHSDLQPGDDGVYGTGDETSHINSTIVTLP